MSVLSGVRVLDFGRYIAGPYCGAILAEYGAEVIRVEKRGGSEDRFVSPLGGDSEGALFTQMNRNKLSITVDPTSPEGREVVRRLVATADVVIANLPPSTLIAMGLDHDSLKAVRRKLVLHQLWAPSNNLGGAYRTAEYRPVRDCVNGDPRKLRR